MRLVPRLRGALNAGSARARPGGRNGSRVAAPRRAQRRPHTSLVTIPPRWRRSGVRCPSFRLRAMAAMPPGDGFGRWRRFASPNRPNRDCRSAPAPNRYLPGMDAVRRRPVHGGSTGVAGRSTGVAGRSTARSRGGLRAVLSGGPQTDAGQSGSATWSPGGRLAAAEHGQPEDRSGFVRRPTVSVIWHRQRAGHASA